MADKRFKVFYSNAGTAINSTGKVVIITNEIPAYITDCSVHEETEAGITTWTHTPIPVYSGGAFCAGYDGTKTSVVYEGKSAYRYEIESMAEDGWSGSAVYLEASKDSSILDAEIYPKEVSISEYDGNGDKDIELNAYVTGTNGASGISYAWKKNGIQIFSGSSPFYTIENPSSSDSGTYTCEITVTGYSPVTTDDCVVSVS